MNTTTSRLLAAAEDIWAQYHAHPFVRGIGDGTLDLEKFRYYMIQDYVYLFDYAKVFAIGLSRTRDSEVLRVFAGYVHQILDGEMEIHKSYMARLGICPEEAAQAQAALDNLSYTSYMLRVAYEEGPAEVMAAILSCALSYEAIAREILKEHPQAGEHPFYGEWVRGYAAPEYHAENETLIALMERLSEGYSEERLAHLTEIFVACSRYELAFWDMAWEQRK